MFPLSAVVQMCCPNIDISFASHRPTERLLMTFVGGNTAANRRTDYISGNNRDTDQNTTENSNRRQTGAVTQRMTITNMQRRRH